MLTAKETAMARAAVERVIGCSLPKDVQVLEGAGLVLQDEGCSAQIQAQDVNTLCRGLFLLHLARISGKPCRTVERRNFASCGLMLDVSRNAVLKTEAVQNVIDRMAALGLNLLLMYMEDVYEVDGWPYMGYLRGRYSHAELQELADYAAGLGVEIVPCIQTLAHMKQLLQWDGAGITADQPDVMLVDDERTLSFIEAEIETVSRCFRSRRIHIGMDEAHGIGLGKYYALHGAQDRFEILSRHLKYVTEVCRQKGLKPIMWSDMFFRLGSRQNHYYDLEAEIPPRILEQIPDVQMCYWDYYHTDEATYDRMFARHAQLGDTVFASGLWTWSGFLPHVKRTSATLQPALRSCLRHGVLTVFATLWGDDGAETNCMLALNQLPLLSEACWHESEADPELLQRMGEVLTGVPHAAFEAMGEFYPNEQNACMGKGLIWCDVLFPLVNFEKDTLQAAGERARHALKVLEGCPECLECRYASLLFDVAACKADLLSQLRGRYLSKDSYFLRRTAEETIPALLSKYEALLEAHRMLWERDMKRLGWEVLCLRYGAVMERLRDVQNELFRYLQGDLPRMEALDEPVLCTSRWGGRHVFTHYISPSAIV